MDKVFQVLKKILSSVIRFLAIIFILLIILGIIALPNLRSSSESYGVIKVNLENYA